MWLLHDRILYKILLIDTPLAHKVAIWVPVVSSLYDYASFSKYDRALCAKHMKYACVVFILSFDMDNSPFLGTVSLVSPGLNENMMKSLHRTLFRVTGPLWGASAGLPLGCPHKRAMTWKCDERTVEKQWGCQSFQITAKCVLWHK